LSEVYGDNTVPWQGEAREPGLEERRILEVVRKIKSPFSQKSIGKEGRIFSLQ